MSDDEGGKKSGYRLEYAGTVRSKCKGPKPCGGNSIAKGELRLGSLVDFRGNTSFTWRHWGCTTSKIIENIKKSFEEASELNGYDELRPEDQAKIDKAWVDGHVADEDIPETARKPVKDDEGGASDPDKDKEKAKKKAKAAAAAARKKKAAEKAAASDEEDDDEPKKKRAPPKKKAPAEKKEKAPPKKRAPKKKKQETDEESGEDFTAAMEGVQDEEEAEETRDEATKKRKRPVSKSKANPSSKKAKPSTSRSKKSKATVEDDEDDE